MFIAMRHLHLFALILVVHLIAQLASWSISGPFYIQSLANCEFLDTEDQRMCMGGKVITSPLFNKTSQMWYFHDSGTGYMIVNRFNGLVLDVDGGGLSTPGSEVITWGATYKCNQRWSFEGDGVIRSGSNNLVLEVCLSTKPDKSSRVFVNNRTGSIGQQFRTILVGAFIPPP